MSRMSEPLMPAFTTARQEMISRSCASMMKAPRMTSPFHLAFVGQLRPFGVSASQKEVVRLHDSVDAFVVHGPIPLSPELPVQECGDPAVALGGARRHQCRDQRQDVRGFSRTAGVHPLTVLRLVVAPPRLRAPVQTACRFERETPRVSATTFTGNRPLAATARATSVFLSGSCPVPP
jgi:hypothetical protein